MQNFILKTNSKQLLPLFLHQEIHSPQKAKAFSNTITDYPGSYKSEEHSTEYKIQVKADKLTLTHPRLNDIVLTPIGADRFSGINGFPIEISFTRVSNKIIGFEISNFGVKKLFFSKKI